MAHSLHRPGVPGSLRHVTALLWLLAAAPLLAQTPASRELGKPGAAAQVSAALTGEPTDAVEGSAPLDASGSNTAPLIPANFYASGEDIRVEREPSTSNAPAEAPWLSSGYDHGFVIRHNDTEGVPFELKINSQNQIRYVAFDRAVPTWTDSAGVVSPVVNVSNFQLPRGRIIFSGFAFRPELIYDLNIDYNTVTSNQINFRAYWLGWRFNRAVTIYTGQSKVPGSREWLLSTMNMLGPDRSMASTFFRPSLSQGIWITGEPVDGWFYHAMIANGFNTLGSTPDQLNSHMTFSGSTWIDPLGNFGQGYSDFEQHDDPVIRLGTSLTYAPIQGPQGNPDAPDNSEVRLSDGTVLTDTGALAPGVTLNAYKIGLAAIDFAFKYDGFSFSTELYLQDLFSLKGNGPLPRSSVAQYGGYVQAGYFVMPQKLELYSRVSNATGPFGTGKEYAGGFNWFFLPNRQNLRFTADAAWLDHCPADQNRTNYQAGQTGWLLRTQMQVFF